jgi:hypothetical protein
MIKPNSIFLPTVIVLGLNVFCFTDQSVDREAAKHRGTSQEDTVYLCKENVPAEFVFTMRNKNVDTGKLFLMENGTMVFTTNEVGYFRTKNIYRDYKLHVEWKWPEKAANFNSGVLVHTQKPDSVWPNCIQVQLKQQRAGDLIAMYGAMFNEAVGKPKDTAERISNSTEKLEGEWNSCDIICMNDSVIVYVNGVIQNKATKTNYNEGSIGFQLEGKPISFRNIFLTKSKKIN